MDGLNYAHPIRPRLEFCREWYVMLYIIDVIAAVAGCLCEFNELMIKIK